MDARYYIYSCLAQTLWNESIVKQEGLTAMIGAALVIRNRVMAGWSNEWLEVISKFYNYSANLPPDSFDFGSLHDYLFLQLLNRCENIYAGTEFDFTSGSRDTLANKGGALWYCNLNRIDNDWFLEKIVRNPEEHPRIAQVGQITFFK